MSAVPGVYVLQFDNGFLKVGASLNTQDRVQSHISNASIYGVQVVRDWVCHCTNPFNEETRVLGLLADIAGVVFAPGSSRETFRGIDFDTVIQLVGKSDVALFEARNRKRVRPVRLIDPSRDEDQVAEFIRDRIVVTGEKSDLIFVRDLYEAWVDWSGSSALSGRAFASAFAKLTGADVTRAWSSGPGKTRLWARVGVRWGRAVSQSAV